MVRLPLRWRIVITKIAATTVKGAYGAVEQPERRMELYFRGYCSEVCPKHVDPAAAIQQGK